VRIVHVYNQLDPRNGGPPHVIIGLAAAQRALGHDIVLVSEDKPNCEATEAFITEHLGPDIIRFSIQPRAFISALTRTQFQHALTGADIVHLHGVWPVVSMMASRVCKAMGIPYVFAPHGSLHDGALREKRVKKLMGMWILGYRAYIRDAAALHALNQHEADGASHPFYVGVELPQLVDIIPNGVDPNLLDHKPSTDAVHQLCPDLGQSPFILYLSRLHPGKGCDLLGQAFVQVASRFPDIHLVMVGQDQGGRQMAEVPIRKAGLLNRVHFTGPIFDERKYALYEAATVFCLPSRHEGFSMALTEAMALRCPVVATRTCYFPELTDEHCGLETDLSAPSLAEAIGQVLSDPVAAVAMGQRGRQLVENRFTWTKIAESTIALYSRCQEAP
tara:strand:+ start:1884 stop:3050 length:1167 start_codon:yes stop_codon:yes gene_type:complete